jgi:hypothetical protein
MPDQEHAEIIRQLVRQVDVVQLNFVFRVSPKKSIPVAEIKGFFRQITICVDNINKKILYVLARNRSLALYIYNSHLHVYHEMKNSLTILGKRPYINLNYVHI